MSSPVVRKILEDDAVPVPAAVVPAWQMKRRRRRRVAEALIGEAQDQVMRFDCQARVEVFVTPDDIEFESEMDKIRESGQPEEQRIQAAKELAMRHAQGLISGVRDVEITADCTLADVNIDRIDWSELVKSKAERGAEEEERDREFEDFRKLRGEEDVVKKARSMGAKLHRRDDGRWVCLDMNDTPLWMLTFPTIQRAAEAFIIQKSKETGKPGEPHS
jgi:hypothetical protein